MVFTLSRVPRYHNFECNISLAMHIISHPDNRETAMTQLMVDAIPAGKDVSNVGRVVRAPGVMFWVFYYLIELIVIL
jgi:hypothetical protein